MPQRIAADGMEWVFGDFNKVGPALARELYDRLAYEMLQRKTDFCFGDSFLVEYATANSVTVRAGVGFQNDATQADPEPTKRMIYRSAQSSHTIEAPHASLPRIDIVCIKANRANTITESRKYKDPTSGIISSQSLPVQSDWQADILLVAGTPNASPVAPATPAGYLKIGSVEVTAVSGIAGAGAVTDNRTKAPVAGLSLLNTLGKSRVTAGAETTLDQVITDIDALLKRGNFEYFDMEDLEADPAAPVTADYHRLYFKEGVLYERATGGTISPIGGGSGGGGGGAWRAPEGVGPLEAEENGEKVFLFDPDGSQKVVLFVKVPQSYLSGRQIKMYIGHYSPSASGTQRLKTRTYLVRKNLDAVSSTTNFEDSTNVAITNTVANQFREVMVELTNATGQINSVGVSAGDILRVELSRDAADTDTDDIRFIPSATEVKFS